MSRHKTRLSLLIIASMFLLPLLAVWLMLKDAFGLKPGSVIHFGQPVEPPAEIAWPEEAGKALRGRWNILFMAANPCEPSCRNTIFGLQQAYKALRNHPAGLQIAVRVPADSNALEDELRKTFPEALLLSRDDTGDPNQPGLEQQVLSVLRSTTAAGASFIVSPQGNIMMYYAAGTESRYIQKDLMRLLAQSKLGD